MEVPDAVDQVKQLKIASVKASRESDHAELSRIALEIAANLEFITAVYQDVGQAKADAIVKGAKEAQDSEMNATQTESHIRVVSAESKAAYDTLATYIRTITTLITTIQTRIRILESEFEQARRAI